MRSPLKSLLPPAAMAGILFLSTPQGLPAGERKITLTDAVYRTLETNPGVKIEEERVQQSEGELQSASGQFDWTGVGTFSKEVRRDHLTDEQEKQAELASLFTQRHFSDNRREQTTIYSLGAKKQSRSGVVVYPKLSTLDSEDLTVPIESENRSDVSAELIIPLMRGLGEANTGALEMAAQSRLTATEFFSKHNISGRILQTASAYWSSLAALHTLKIMEDAISRAEEIYRLVELLVKGGEVEPALMHQAQAKLAQRKADIKQSELNYYESRQRLALAMGLSPGELADPPSPEGPFPPVTDVRLLDKALEARYIQQALERRGDYQAARTGINTQEILLQKASDDRRMRLDLDLGFGMSGLNERGDWSRYYRSLYHDKAGPNVFAGLSLEWPIENNTAVGEYLRRKSLVREQKLTVTQLSQGIASDVLVSLERLRSSFQEYRLSRDSVEAYKEAVKHENYKVRMGESSLTSLIDIEDQYLEARLSHINALRRYAAALAELRYATGTLLTEESRSFRFRTYSLMTLPVLQEPIPEKGPEKSHE
ncbi:MAG: TolC family protein [Thermodesulfobacteriota bacterium]